MLYDIETYYIVNYLRARYYYNINIILECITSI